MTQTIENKCLSLEDILKTLRSEAESMPHSPTSVRYLRALSSFSSSSYCVAHGTAVFNRPPQSGSNHGQSDPEDSIQQTEDSNNTALRANTAASAANTQYSILHTSLTDWLVNLWLTATPFSTASLYLDIISALYTAAVKADRLPKTAVFSELKTQLKALGPQGWKSGIDDEIFARALRLTKNAGRLIADDAIAADLILLSLTQGLEPLEQLAMIKKEDCVAMERRFLTSAVPSSPNHGQSNSEDSRLKTEDSKNCAAGLSSGETTPHVDTPPLGGWGASREIIARHAGSARRKYLFPLNQSQRTELQLKRHIAKICNALFRRARLPQATDPMQTVEALWAYAALRTGIPASKIVAALGHAPLGLPVLKLSAPLHPKGGASEAVDTPPLGGRGASIGKIFLDNPPRWYAMSLRPGVRFTQVCRRIDLLAPQPPEGGASSSILPLQGAGGLRRGLSSSLSLFYPCEEIARAIGKKIVIKQRPFIHSVVFFKAKLTDIGPLFAKIGDLAWCYRQSAAPGAPYAEISESQFLLFQRTIATFTPDFEVASSGELELKKDDKVVILGGLFAGHTATVEAPLPPKGGASVSVESPPSGGRGATIYRLNIVGDNGIEWRIGVDKRLVMESGHPDR